MPKKLSKRLQSIANLVPKNSYIADIGSDHAQLPIYLCETGTVSWAQAVENKTGPFLRMTHAIQESGLEGHIDCSRSDGISDLNEGVDTVLICGMGGMLACDILEAHTEKLFHVQTIIVDPHKDLVSVRKRVTALGYKIDEETMVYEDKIFISINTGLAHNTIFLLILAFHFKRFPYTLNNRNFSFTGVRLRRIDAVIGSEFILMVVIYQRVIDANHTVLKVNISPP